VNRKKYRKRDDTKKHSNITQKTTLHTLQQWMDFQINYRLQLPNYQNYHFYENFHIFHRGQDK